MKRVLTFVLAAVMIIVLCACGGASAPAPAPSTEAAAAQAPEPVATTEEPAPPAEVKESEDHTEEPDALTVEDIKMENASGGGLLFKVKVQNNTESDFGMIAINYQLLDQDGTVLYSNMLGSVNLLAGQRGWLGPYAVEAKDCESAEAIQFVSYFTDQNTMPTIFHEITKYSLSGDHEAETAADTPEPVEAASAEPAADDAPESDPIEIEEVVIRKSSSGCKIQLKVRNTGDMAREILQVNLQVLDAAGDVLTNADPTAYNLEAGQAGKTEFERIDYNVDEISSIRIFGYRYGTGTELVRKFNANDKYKLNTPIIFTMDEITIE